MADESMTIDKSVLYGIIIVVLAGLVVLSVLTQGFGIIKTAPEQAPQNTTALGGNTQPTTTTPSIQQLSVDVGNYPPLGQASAPVSIVEFSDFECPFCGALYSDAEAQIRTNYVNSGKVKFYYRDFPLTSIHPDAMDGAIAARCANDQGQFWAMHDKLFDNQNTWSSQPDPKATLEQYAQTLGLVTTTFNSCYENQSHVSEINADEMAGSNDGVQGTPGLFIIIPKNKVSLATLQSSLTSGLTLFQDSSNYIVFVAGAYPYSTFDAVLSKVSY